MIKAVLAATDGPIGCVRLRQACEQVLSRKCLAALYDRILAPADGPSKYEADKKSNGAAPNDSGSWSAFPRVLVASVLSFLTRSFPCRCRACMRGMIQRVAFIGRWYLDLDDFADPLALTWIPLVLGKRTAHLRSVRSTRSCCLFEPCASTSDAFQRIEVLDISADSTFVRSLQNFPALAALTIHITTIRDPDAATEWPPLLHLTRLRLTNNVVLKLSMKSRKGCRKHEWTRSILNLRIGACGCFSQSLANQKLNCSARRMV